MIKKLLYVGICLLFAQISVAQFVDDFSDGDFINNPTWSGDAGLFTVTAGELNSQNTGANNYYLSTPSTLAVNAQWDFFFNMQFSTSGANYVDVYLMSDVANVTTPNDGYFVRIGGTPDEVSLYKIVGGATTLLIDGPNSSVNSSSNNPFNVRVTRDVTNNWTLFYDDGAASSLVTIGTIVDNAINTSSFFGVSITQSGAASPINGHFFDNFSVGAIVGDTASPLIDSLVVQSSTTLDAYFNEPVGLTTSQTLTNYSADLGLGNPSAAVRDALDSSIVHLTFGAPFTNGQNYNLTINNVEDSLGNATTGIIEPFSYLVVIAPNNGDVIINEIFADPSPQIGLPTEEFVELYNSSNNTFVLNNWKFVNTTTVKALPNFILQPNNYVILCDINDTLLYQSFGDVIGISSFSALTNGGDSLTLMDDNNSILDIVAYDIGWYQDGVKDDGGYTLERINPNHPCSNSLNWIASNDAIGGTPGTLNSVFNNAPDTDNPIISGVNILAGNQINVVFNETMDSASIANAAYTLTNGIVVMSIVVNNNLQGADLTLGSTLDSSTVYTLSVAGANDCSGNLLSSNTIDFGIGKAPQKYEIVINELYPDPTPSNGLPLADYLELYNTTNKIIDLTDCWIADLTSMDQLNVGKILPGEHIIVCDNSFEVEFVPYGKVITVNSLPSLNNAEDDITLFAPDTSLIHRIHYFDEWYRDDNKKDGGWSLEMIDPNNPCGEAENWIASTKFFGGTPGTQNTAFGTNPDVVLPQVTEANALNDSTVLVTFSEPLDNEGMLAAIYVINNSISITAVEVLDGKNVQLHLTNKLTYQIKYTVTITGAFDCVGNTIGSNNTAIFALPEQGSSKDIVINEVLFNPLNGGVDFVEIYNNSNKFIDLQNWNLANLDNDSIDNYKPLIEHPKLILPGEFVLLSTNSGAVENDYMNSVSDAFLQMESFPTYSNDEGDVYLINNLDIIVDEFHYKDDMHFALLNSEDGVSLERIDYDRPTSDDSNWHSAAEGEGFATPGFENSQYQMTNNEGEEIVVEPETFSPDNDGVDDVLNISYNFSEPGYVATVIVYDAKGRLVKNLIQNELLGISGTFSWDGINERNEKARIGIYIILVEAFSADGDVKSFKKTAVLAGYFD
ncbi:MAG: lamin tail domain-containing protein [Vicingaceae bacterium]|nr:lamin tail domain-containing protein [Vicingaceae bacterium]